MVVGDDKQHAQATPLEPTEGLVPGSEALIEQQATRLSEQETLAKSLVIGNPHLHTEYLSVAVATNAGNNKHCA